MIYIANALESVNARVRRIIKAAATFQPTRRQRRIWLALRNITARWAGKASNDWHLAMQR